MISILAWYPMLESSSRISHTPPAPRLRLLLSDISWTCFFVMRRSLLFKPSRTGRRAAKASSTAGSPDELKILNMTYKVIFSQQEQISFNCSDSRSTILYAASWSVMLKTNAAPMWRFEIAGMGDRFTVNQHLRSRPTIKDLQ